MPRQTKNAASTTARLAKTNQAELASAKTAGYKCQINGCNNGTFRNQTDLSRHKWTHLPAHLRPTCPFEGPYGQRCDVGYTGRADAIRAHWERDHPEAGPCPKIDWPTLNKVLTRHQIKLGESSPRIFTPQSSSSPSPPPSHPPLPQASVPVEQYPNVPWSFGQHGALPAYGFSPQYGPFAFSQGGLFQPPAIFTQFPPAMIPQYQQYTNPTYPTFGYGVYPTAGEARPPSPFETQVEDLDLDASRNLQFFEQAKDLDFPMSDEQWAELVEISLLA